MQYHPDELFKRAQAGDNRAWEQLISECSPKLLRVIRRKLGQPMRSVYDSADFVNDVFKSLVAKSGRFDFPNMAALTAYLLQAAEQKVIDEYRKQNTDKRDSSRNRSLHDGPDHSDLELASPEPTPSQFATARETADHLLESSTGADRDVLLLKSLDYSNEEVARQTGIHLRSVQRLLKRVFDTRIARN